MSFNSALAKEMLEEARLILDIGGAVPVDTPSLVILGGQPGSGKSSAIEMIEARFEGNIFALNGDDFKELYPDYAELVKANKEQASHVVQDYSNYVVNHLKQEYSDLRYNLIIEGTMRTSEVPISTIEEFKAKGYQAEAYVVASNYYASRTGCLLRMEMDIADNGYGRSVPIESHDAAYNNIPLTMQKLLDSGQLENITIMSRSGHVLGDLKHGDNVIEIYQAHREKFSLDEYTKVSANLNQALALMQQRSAAAVEIDNVTQLQNDMTIKYATGITTQIDRLLTDYAGSLDKEQTEQLTKLIDAYPAANLINLPDGNIMLNQQAKESINAFLKHAHHGQPNNEAGELAVAVKQQLIESLPVKISFPERLALKDSSDNLQNLYKQLQQADCNVISFNDYKQIINQMTLSAEHIQHSQSVNIAPGRKITI